MDHSKQTIMVALAAAAAVIAVCFAFVITDDRDGGTEADDQLTGYWYAVGVAGYSVDGTYTELTLADPAIAAYDLSVHENNGGVLIGYTYGSNFTGYLAGSQIDFSGATYTVFGAVDGGLIRGVLTVQDGEASASYAVSYARERSAPAAVAVPDLTGTWTNVSATGFHGDGVLTEIDRGDITITAMNGQAFLGTMVQSIGEGTATLAISGTVTAQNAGNGSLAVFVDSVGYRWTCAVSAKQLTVSTTAVSNSDKIEGSVSIERVYTRGGAAETGVAAVLSGTSWSAVGAYVATEYFGYNSSETAHIAAQWEVDFTAQTGNQVLGTYTYGSGSGQIVGYLLAGDPTVMAVSLLQDGVSFRGTMVFGDDRTCSFGMDAVSDQSGGVSWNTTMLTTFYKEEAGQEYSALGHWYNVHAEGYNSDGRHINTASRSANLQPYELTVFKVENGLFCGYFNGSYVTGTYLDNEVCFNCDCDLGYTVFRGRILNAETMLATELFYDAATGETQAWSAFLSTCWYDQARMLSNDGDISGSWTAISANTCDKNGDRDLLGTALEIGSYRYNTFKGTMEQTVVGELKMKNIWGVLDRYEVDESGAVYMAGTIFDDTGMRWSYVLDGGYLYLYGLFISDSIENGILAACERVYTKDGTGTAAPTAAVDLGNTAWSASSVRQIAADGTVRSYGAASISIGELNGVRFCGTVSTTQGQVQDLVGYTVGNKVYILTQLGDSLAYWYGWVEDGKLTIVQYLDIADGSLTYLAVLSQQP